MLAAKFNELRARLDALGSGEVPPLGLFARAKMLLTREAGAGSLDGLLALDDDLEHAGVHTTADARLLRDLGQLKGRAQELREGLSERAERSIAAFEKALGEVEWRAASGEPVVERLTRLERDFARLGRVVKVAAVFAGAPGAGADAAEGDVEGDFEIYPVSRLAAGAAPALAKVAVAERLAQRAAKNVSDSSQKRRDLDLAYELVLVLSAEANEDRDRVRRLRVELAAARDRVRSSPAVRSLDELVRHLRHTARRDPRTAFRSLRALYDRAVEGGDVEVAKIASEAIRSLVPQGTMASLVQKEDARRLMGWREPASADVPERLAAGGKGGLDDELSDVLAQLAFDLDEDQQRALALASGAARFFDIEGSLSEEMVEAETRALRSVQRRVGYPTQTMSYEFTGSLDEIHNFVVTHPGTVVLDLASGRQMVRAYLEEEPPPKPRRLKKTAVRVYVLDASGSMHGARASFRDAILIAELNAIRVKAKVGLPFDPLYFSFFNDSPSQLSRVDSGTEATRQLGTLFQHSLAEGQTDISQALVAAFESIGNAKGRDPYLARATVVLVTDGEDGVDLELLRRAKKPYEGLDIALSFISLGEENPDLKSLVLEQRRAGARAFYHHLSDLEIQLARTEFDSAFRTLLPSDAPMGPDTLEKLLPHLEALEAIAQGRPRPVAGRSALQFDALFPSSSSAPMMSVSAPLRTRLLDILEAIAETAGLAPAEGRAAEAVELLSHLLSVYSIPMAHYLEAVGEAGLGKAVARVRLLCRPFDE